VKTRLEPRLLETRREPFDPAAEAEAAVDPTAPPERAFPSRTEEARPHPSITAAPPSRRDLLMGGLAAGVAAVLLGVKGVTTSTASAAGLAAQQVASTIANPHHRRAALLQVAREATPFEPTDHAAAVHRLALHRRRAEPTEIAQIARASAWLDRAERSGFSGSVLVARGGRVLLEKGSGLADRARARRNGPETLFDVGSVTKQFVATAILQLEDRGLLSVDDPISRYLAVPRGPKAQITLRQLLQHRSGLGYPNDAPGDRGPDPNDGRAFFESFLKDAPLQSRPGSRFSYNNLGYGVLGYVLEKLSGERFEDYLRNHLFLPAGMHDTGFNVPGSIDRANAAMGYEGKRRLLAAGDLPNDWGYRGATGVITNVRDLFKWTEAVRSGAILSPSARDKLLTPPAGGDYAFGWSVVLGRDGKPIRAFHDGATMGFLSMVTMDLDHGYTVVTLSNDYARGGRFLGGVERALGGNRG
jgi:CubicO group peptidase (beta-lactamase class C family)